LGEMMNVAGNKYLADEEPWKMIKLMQGVQTQMYVALNSAACYFVNHFSFTSTKLSRILKIDSPLIGTRSQKHIIYLRHQMGSRILFQKKTGIQKQIDKLLTKTANSENKKNPQKEDSI
jgi:methionyl-tRNA synthetase